MSITKSVRTPQRVGRLNFVNFAKKFGIEDLAIKVCSALSTISFLIDVGESEIIENLNPNRIYGDSTLTVTGSEFRKSHKMFFTISPMQVLEFSIEGWVKNGVTKTSIIVKLAYTKDILYPVMLMQIWDDNFDYDALEKLIVSLINVSGSEVVPRYYLAKMEEEPVIEKKIQSPTMFPKYIEGSSLFAPMTPEMIQLSKDYLEVYLKSQALHGVKLVSIPEDFYKTYFVDGAYFDFLGITQTETTSTEDTILSIEPMSMMVSVNDKFKCLAPIARGDKVSTDFHGTVKQKFYFWAFDDLPESPKDAEIILEITSNVETGNSKITIIDAVKGLKVYGVQLFGHRGTPDTVKEVA